MVTGMVLIRFVAGKEKAALRGIKAVEGVKEVKGVFGRWDAVATVEAGDLNDLAALVVGKIRAIPGVATTDTLITAEL